MRSIEIVCFHQAILTMLKSLGWENYMPVMEDSVQTVNLMEQLVDQSDGRICPVQKPAVLPKMENGYASVYKEIAESKMCSTAISFKMFKIGLNC